jgi:3-dehydrosphinganine reductase
MMATVRPIHWFSGKKVFVTGGSSGIGKAAAEILAKSGAHVQIAARGEQRLAAALAEIQQHRVAPDQRIGAVACDVADSERMREVAREVTAAMGGIDVLVNNAGVAHPATIEDTSDETFERMMRINYFGTVYCTRAFLPYFKEQRGGHIANVSSLLGFMGIFGYTAYAASKHAVTGFSDCLRQEMLDYDVRVSVLFPGDTDTPQLAEENRIKPPETKAIAGKVKVMSAESVAAALLRGISRGRYHILVGFDSKLTYFVQRHFPSLLRWIIDQPLKKHRRERKNLATDEHR